MIDLIIILGIIGCMGASFSFIVSKTDGERLASATALAVIFFLASIAIAIEQGQYKQGQVDALTGKVKYELNTKPDSTRVWEKIERDEK